MARQRSRLVQAARLLAAGDAHLAEDLVQAVLTKLYLSWPAFKRATNPHGYLRRMLVNVLVDERGRAWRRLERPVAQLPERAALEAAVDPLDEDLKQALRCLPHRMRAAIVFRYFYELDVAETAEALGCSTGTVKSQTARALDKLRSSLEQSQPHTADKLAPLGADQ